MVYAILLLRYAYVYFKYTMYEDEMKNTQNGYVLYKIIYKLGVISAKKN